MTRVLCSLCALGLLAGSAGAAEPKALAAQVAPFLDDGTVAVLHLDLGFDPIALDARLAKLVPMAAPWKEPLFRLDELRKHLENAGFNHLFLVFGTTMDPNGPLIVLTQDRKQAGDPLEALGRLFPGGVKRARGAYIAGPPAVVKRTAETTDPPAPAAELVADLTAALENAGTAPVQVALLLSPAQRRILQENLPRLPAPFADVTGRSLAQGFRWGVATLTGGGAEGYRLRLHVEAANAEAARELAGLADKGLEALGRVPELREALPVPALKKALAAQVQGSAVTITVQDAPLVTALLPAIQKAQGAAAVARDVNHLKQIGLALHGHADEHRGKFPAAAITDNQGQPLLSWRVRILPYLGADAKALYGKFKLDEPWDSEHNKKLIREMPAVYRATAAGKAAEDGRTTFVVPVGADTIFPPGKAIGFADILDGTSNTILVLEIDAEKAVPWTKPADLEVDLAKPLTGVGFNADGKVSALFGDGSVRRIARMIDPKVLAALFTRAGGEVIGNIP